jgi:hypothetical protein
MDNRVDLFEEKLRYSSFEVKGGFGSTNDSFCCFESSETGIVLYFGTLPNMNVNAHAAERCNIANLVITLLCITIKSYNFI